MHPLDSMLQIQFPFLAILENRILRGAKIDLIDIAHARFQRLSIDVYLRTVLETFVPSTT